MALLEVQDIQVYYGMIQALKGVSFSVNEGEVIALIGANGAGKTTTLHTITGLLPSKKGTVTFEGQDITKVPAHKIVYMGVAHVPEGRRVFADLSVYQNLKMGAYTRKDKEEIEQTLAMVYERFPRLKERKDQRAGTLSGGEQQLVLIARALAQNARTIIMDEPTSALDYGNTMRVLGCVRQLAREGLSIIQSTHQPDQAFLFADKVLAINKGRVRAFGDPRDVITEELVAELYGVDVSICSLFGDRMRVCVPSQEIDVTGQDARSRVK